MPTGGSSSSSGLVSLNGDVAIVSVAGNALNTDIITGDFTAYQSIKVNLSGTFVATWTVQVCHEPTFTNNVSIATIYNSSTSSWIQGTGTIGGNFTIPTNQGRYIRIRVTAFTSGSINGVVSGSQANIGSSTQLLSSQIVKIDRSGATSGTVNTATTLMAANSSRYGWSITNKSNAIIFVNETGVTATGNNLDRAIQPNETYTPTSIVTTSISIICKTLALANYEAKEWNTPNVANSTLFVQGSNPTGAANASQSFPVALPLDYLYPGTSAQNIITQNLNPFTGAATVGSFAVLNVNSPNTQTISFQLVSPGYTISGGGFGLICQGSIDGITWTTISKFVRVSRNEIISNIPSGEQGIFLIKNSGFRQIRVVSNSGTPSAFISCYMMESNAAYPLDATPARYIASNDLASTVSSGNMHFTMVGNNKTIVTIKKITWSDYNTTVANTQKIIQYGKGTAFVGGTSGGLTTSRLNPNQLVEQSFAIGYSASPTVTGNANIGQFNSGAMITSTTGSGYQTIIDNLNYQIVGSSSVFYIQNRTSGTGVTSVCTVEWTEE
jgi:hypothetical protein